MAIVKLIKDLASVIAFALGFLVSLLRPQSFLNRITRAAKTAESYYTDLWIRLYEPGRFIGIWDDVGASFSQTDAWEPFSLRNTVKANDDNNARLESLMSALPPQADGVARVFLQELFDDDVRDNDSASGMDFPYKFPPLRIATVGFLSLISNQYWASPLRWHKIESFNFIESKRGSPQVRWVNVVRYLRFQVIDNRLQDFVNFVTGPYLVQFDMEMNRNAMYKEEVAKRKQQLSTYVHFRILASILWWLGLGLFCIILVVSFLIGMFRDISLGAKVLGYGLAVVSFPAVIALSLTFLLSLMGELVRRRRKARKAAQESPRVERRQQGMGADEENASPVNPPEPTTRMAELASAAANHAGSEDEVANE
ncbi:hypothetical protein CABS01_02096 [Colletotrichum abscissum]|uniref:uncharacterized protein n=1 Tax=Colletotrichum abscissum TaxID=1671311 RepID=UPI0027D4F87A|nr:uncharacterized protein CABS01_02096 [Colletotrichum abscissum]KAK1488466.1 hypothetical protein CABS01_02096 [Colletotrichum abscissum]